MKLNSDIMLGNIDGKDFAIATGSLSKTFNGIINNNPTANYIFTLLKTEQTEDSIVANSSFLLDSFEEETISFIIKNNILISVRNEQLRSFNETVKKMFDERFPDIPRVITLAPVCRPTWLIEMECMAISKKGDSAFRDF